MPDVLIVVPTEEMRREALDAADNVGGLDVEAAVEDSHTVLERVLSAQKNGALVAVARGNHANLIMKHTNIPLVEIRLGGQSIAQLIMQAKQLCGRTKPTVAFLGFPNMFSDIKPFEDILGVSTLEFQVDDSNEIPLAVERAKASGADVLISGDTGLQAAKAMGLPAVFLRSGKDDMVTALRIAKRLLYAIELEKKNTVEVTTLLNYSFDGIIKVDPKGIITMANYMAERIFRRASKDLIGQRITAFFDDQDAKSITQRLQYNERQQSFMLHKGNVSLIANLANLIVSGRSEGAILSFQEFGTIEAMEEIIRQDRHSRVQKALRHFSDLDSSSPWYNRVLEEAKHCAQFDMPLLLLGEVGTGRRTLAECVHNASLRRDRPFVAMDCAGLPDHLQEDLLSGNEQNSVFRGAHTGTLFIDNIHLLTQTAQYQLLSSLRDGIVWQMDHRKALPVNVRLIAASVTDLAQLARQGRFNLSLQTMLSQFTIRIPSLRQRTEDIPSLTDHYIARYCTKYRKHIMLTPEARQIIAGYPWPGNLMQLNLYAEKLVVMAVDKVITADFVLRTLPEGSLLTEAIDPPKMPSAPIVVYRAPEAEAILRALDRHHNNRSAAAQELGISKTTLWRRMKENGIQGSFRLGD